MRRAYTARAAGPRGLPLVYRRRPADRLRQREDAPMQVTKHLTLTSPRSPNGSSPARGRDCGTEAGDGETGVPPVKCRRVIVNRRRQLELVEDDLPSPRPGEVRLKMLAAGVSYPDVMMRQGIHPEARRPPFTPGWDVVGTVDALGDGARDVPPGATVAAMPIVGGD